MSETIAANVYKKWKDALKAILDRAAQAAKKKGDTLTERLKISKEFTAFIRSSRPNVPEILELDAIAKKAAIDLLRKEIEDRVAKIQSRDAEYAALIKVTEARIVANKEAAATLRLTKVTAAIDAATQTVESFKKAKESLKDTASDQKLSKALDDATKTVEALKKLLAKVT